MQRIETPQNSEHQICTGVNDDAASLASTIRHGHESFVSFQHKVSQVVAKYFKQQVSDIKVDHIKGGSYNRVVAVSLSAKPKKYSMKWFKARCLGARPKVDPFVESYIVRIPRQDGCDMARDVAILKAVGAQLTLPIPKVVTYDLSADNVFDKPYMIQTRLLGGNLAQLWDTLNMEQKKSVAKRVTILVSTIASAEAPAGDISLENLSQVSEECIRVEKFCVPARGLEDDSFDKPNTWPAQSQKPLQHLLEQCERWREYQTSQDACFDEIWGGLAAISNALEVRGFLEGPNVLLHGDLKAYNLLAEVRSHTEVEITGILDWDYAVIAPEVMAYRVPFWLWIPEDMNSVDEDDESNANLEARTDEDQALKDVFLTEASEKYKRLAFAPEALLARRMFPILRKGIFGPWNMMEAENIIREWDELHPEDGVVVVGADDLGPDFSP
ncbi:Nn.00g053800.m01.CDS01 [Neocucurbitaria sp. VM-36]